MRSIELVLENVRCFHQRTTINFRPLTLLVGENSAGKTTAMAMLSAVCGRRFPQKLVFDPPYDFGGYDTIATYRGGKAGRSKSFSVGFRLSGPQPGGEEILVEFGDVDGTPAMIKLLAGDGQIGLDLAIRKFRASGTFTDRQGKSVAFNSQISKDLVDLPFALMSTGKVPGEAVGFLTRFTRPLRVRSLAPVRTRPRRTYDELKDEFSPEGDHIPLLLARLWREPNGRREIMVDMLRRFGKESGLFRGIDVRRLGKNAGDPFQVRISIDGLSANIPDVGYGISQALPVIVQSTLLSDEYWLLMQQPEVHLHPRAQAALGTFFAELVAKGQKGLVVETHSDFLLDRVRQEVANGTIKPEDVVIHYFERRRGRAQVHEINLDPQGNLVGVPPGYRQFFIDEEMRLLSRGD